MLSVNLGVSTCCRSWRSMAVADFIIADVARPVDPESSAFVHVGAGLRC
jgi:hypothetical protein